jgi:NAD(P)-dependent dehydrogenase (short-subunit alcohol dehydrogenase family)
MPSTVVLITGALSGIGRATALAYARDKARIVVSGRSQALGDELVRELRALGAEAEYVGADVRVEKEVRELVDKTVSRFGRLDVAVNNAGTEGKPGPVLEQDAASYHNTFDTNVLGVLLSMKHEVRVMATQGQGSIVNITSAYGKLGAAYASVYVASKHALEGLSKSAAIELAGRGIRVNMVAPGPIETGMLNRFAGTQQAKALLTERVALKRVGTPQEMADVIKFVASDQASYIVGASISADGGMTAG